MGPFDLSGLSRHSCVSVCLGVFCGASMFSLMSPPNSSHVAGAVPRFHGIPPVVAGLLPSAGSLWEVSSSRCVSVQTAQDVESLNVLSSRDPALMKFLRLAKNGMLEVVSVTVQAFRGGQCFLGWMRAAMLGACVFSYVSDGLSPSFPGCGSALRAAMLAAILMLLSLVVSILWNLCSETHIMGQGQRKSEGKRNPGVWVSGLCWTEKVKSRIPQVLFLNVKSLSMKGTAALHTSAAKEDRELPSIGAAFGDGGPARLSLIQEVRADACAAAYCALAGLIMFALFFVSAAAAMGSIAAAWTVWHNEQWIAAASAAATVVLVALGKFGHVSEFPFTVVAERVLTVASTAMGLVPTTSSPQDGQADLQGQPWKSLPIKGECELEVTRNLDIVPQNSWLELEKQSFPVFVRTLNGTVSIHCTSDMLVSEFAQLVEKKTRVPSSLTYLTLNGRYLHEGDFVGSTGMKRDDSVTVRRRLKGGARRNPPPPPLYDEWYCARCQRGGCYSTKFTCFRCGLSRLESEAFMGNFPPPTDLKGKGKGKAHNFPPREQQYPGRSTPPADQNGLPPTTRRWMQDSPSPSKADDLSQLTALLTRLGCSENVLNEVRTAVESHNKPKPRMVPAAEKQVFILKGKMDRAQKHLEHLRSVAEQKQKEYEDAVQRATEQAGFFSDIRKEYWKARKELEKKPDSETTSEEDVKCDGPTIVSCDDEEPVQDTIDMAIPSGSEDDTHMNETYPEEMLQDYRPKKRSVIQTKKKGANKVKVVPIYKELDECDRFVRRGSTVSLRD